MIKISSDDIKAIQEYGFFGHSTGCYSEWGAVIGDNEYIVILDDLGDSIAHRSEFDFSDVFVRIHHPENITPLPVFDDIFEVKEL